MQLTKENTCKIACKAAQVLDDKLAKDIIILNISNVSSIADYFVICSGETSTQIRSLSEYVKEELKNSFELHPKGSETDAKNRWHLLDYGDVVVHIMHREERQYYAIEKFWSHACTVPRDEWKS